MDAPPEAPDVVVNRDEIIKLAEEFERELAPDMQGAIRKQREIHFPQPRGRRKKG